MPLPIAHGLLGACFMLAADDGKTPRQKLNNILLGAFLAVSPDFDYLLNLFPVLGGGWHHGFTHSFAFAIVLAAVVYLLRREGSARKFLIYSLTISSHPILDYLLTKSHGVELFYPFSGQRFKLDLFNFIDYRWRNLAPEESLFALFKICFLEFLVFAPFILLLLYWRRKTFLPCRKNSKDKTLYTQKR